MVKKNGLKKFKEKTVKHSYEDITSRIPIAPLWYDENGVPRYSVFGPSEVGNIYANEVALIEIACQSCETIFHVGVAGDLNATSEKPLAENILNGSWRYGDPPNTGCCPSGPTMNSMPIQVLSYMHSGHKEYTNGSVITDYAKYSEWHEDLSVMISFTDKNMTFAREARRIIESRNNPDTNSSQANASD